MEAIRIAIVGSHRLMRELIKSAIPASDHRFVCVATVPSDEQAVKQCRIAAADLVIFDLAGGCVEEFLSLRQISKPAMDWALLIIANGNQAHMLDALVTRRSCGFLSRENSLEALVHAANLVVSGGTYFDADLHPVLEKRLKQTEETHLSQRERHVLQLITEGYSTKETADILRLSIKTVDKYRTAVMQKLQVHDVVKLTHCAIRMGILNV